MRVDVPARGVVYEVEVPDAETASPGELMSSHIEMILFALFALDDPKVNAVLEAFGYGLRESPSGGEGAHQPSGGRGAPVVPTESGSANRASPPVPDNGLPK